MLKLSEQYKVEMIKFFTFLLNEDIEIADLEQAHGWGTITGRSYLLMPYLLPGKVICVLIQVTVLMLSHDS